jgi:hypothetical protein
MEESNKFGLLLNACYGGFGISEPASDEYLRRGGEYLDDRENLRYDPILHEIFNEFGSKWCSGHCARLQISYIDKIYKDYIVINEYDGIESYEINDDAFEKDELKRTIKVIVRDQTKSSDQKIEEISRLVD